MSPEDKPDFNVDALRDLAGKTVFARGEAYFREDRVELLAVGPDRVLAQVNGTESYRVELAGSGRAFDGRCSCPAFEDQDFCKHMVASALAANAGGGEAMDKDGGGPLERIRNHLKAKGIDALVDIIMDLAEFDPALFRRLDMAASATHGDSKAILARLRRAIDSATHIDDYVGYREADEWAMDVAAVLDTLADLPSAGHGALALELAERAIDRIESAIESVDDSDGHVGPLLERARDIHLAAARVARPDPTALAGDLFEREMSGDYDTFYRAATLYADVLGEEGLAEYRRLATEAWEKLPPRRGGNGIRQHYDFGGNYDRLQGILDAFAAPNGDIDGRVALRTKNLSSPWKYLQLAEFCRSHGREEEALRWVEEGLWVFEDEQPDHRLVLFAAGLLSEAGRKPDALRHLWRAFGKSPTFDLYTRLRQLEGEAACDAAVQSLESGIAPSGNWRSPSVDLLVQILIHEQRFDAAWAAAYNHNASMHIRRQLAGASETTHREHAIGVYAEHIEQIVKLGGNHNYAEAAALIGRMAGLRDTREQAAYVASLKAQHNRKRNFMKLLD